MPTTVFDTFAETAARTPAADFLYIESTTAHAYQITPGAVSWGLAAQKVDDLRRAYCAAGYGHGHRVGLLLDNRPDFFYHWFALNALGVSVVPINSDMRSAELQYLIAHSELCLAVVLRERIEDIAAAALECGASVATMCADGPVPLAASPAPAAGQAIGAATECALLYTSGTTGRPKGCVLSNAYFLYAGQWYARLGGHCTVARDAERVMTPLPLTHMNAMACSTMVVLVAGGCLVQLDRFHPRSWLASAKESRATIVHYLGVMPAMLLSAAATGADRDHGIRWGFGAGVDRKDHALFEQRFGFPLVEAWAMTETGTSACVIADLEPRLIGQSSFGRPKSHVELVLLGDDGQAVVQGEPGELCVRAAGPDPRHGFFTGYLKNQEATDEAWAGGWFHTGDLVREDMAGNLFFVDRKKNVIRRSGENISAVEVESVLNQHPAVKASGVAATPDQIRGDEVLACIVTREPLNLQAQKALAQEVVELALSQLAYYKAPGYVAIVPELPLTPSQKIQRGQLRELAQALPGAAHCFDMRSMKKRQA